MPAVNFHRKKIKEVLPPIPKCKSSSYYWVIIVYQIQIFFKTNNGLKLCACSLASTCYSAYFVVYKLDGKVSYYVQNKSSVN
jgi:hypothetical protein